MRKTLIKRAIVEARKSEFKQRHGCVIFKGDKIISTGFNEIRYCNRLDHKYRRWLDGGLHAEQKAILYCKEDLTRKSLLVIRLNYKSELTNSKPCPCCLKLILDTGIKEIYYSTNNGTIEQLWEY